MHKLILIIIYLFASQRPPINPNYYSFEWKIFTTATENPPPIDHTTSKDIRLMGNGRTYYDWEKRSMLEIYDDFCVPIFEYPNKNFRFPCQFLNVEEKVFLRIFDEPSRPECCLFAENFHPPKPTFAVDNKLTYNSTITIDNDIVDFFTLNIPTPGPFYYGWKKEKINGFRVPAAFSFPTVEPEGWTEQNFFNFKNEKPAKEIFEIPEECKNIKPCEVFPPEIVEKKVKHYTQTNI